MLSKPKSRSWRPSTPCTLPAMEKAMSAAWPASMRLPAWMTSGIGYSHIFFPKKRLINSIGAKLMKYITSTYRVYILDRSASYVRGSEIFSHLIEAVKLRLCTLQSSCSTKQGWSYKFKASILLQICSTTTWFLFQKISSTAHQKTSLRFDWCYAVGVLQIVGHLSGLAEACLMTNAVTMRIDDHRPI